jgi:hypothetical protein
MAPDTPCEDCAKLSQNQFLGAFGVGLVLGAGLFFAYVRLTK